jgi:DeoR family transcriptional regulator, aga operon transcriptional repressor
MQSPAERHRAILDRLHERGSVRVADLSAEMEVSEVTVRKDLRVLEERRLLFRTHGGASRTDPHVLDRPVGEKAELHQAEKRRIGRAAAELVEPMDSIILASGTTVIEMTRHLHGLGELTVITSALDAAMEMLRLPEVEVLMLGGMVRRSSASVVGPYAEQVLREHSCQKLFLGVDGFDLEYGLTTTHALEAQLNRVMMDAAQRVIVITDSSKFGRRGFRRICGIDELDCVITDDGVPDAVVQRLEEEGIDVTVV